MAALGAVGIRQSISPSLTMSISAQKLETFAPDVLFNLVEQFRNNPGSIRTSFYIFSKCKGGPLPAAASTGLNLCKHKAFRKRFCTITESMCPISLSFRAAKRIGRPKQLKFRSWFQAVKEKRPTAFRKRLSSRPTTISRAGRFIHEKIQQRRTQRNISRAVNFM